MIAQVDPSIDARRAAPRRGWLLLFSSWQARISLVTSLLLLIVALGGALIAAYDPTAQSGIPFDGPSAQFALGTDALGRDVVSRVLCGGRQIVLLSLGATFAAYVVGVGIGLLAGYNRERLDSVLMRVLDVVLAFPAILLLLVLTAGAGPGAATEFYGVMLVNIPGIARVVRSATLAVVGRAYVEAAIIRGEPVRTILFREILPNISGSVVADAGPRLAGAFLIIAALNYLGIGVNPPAPDWGAMIFENRSGLTVQPWPVAAPIIMIVALTISLNLLGDAIARSLGRSIDTAAGQ